jgi:hypothetical protein
MIIIVGLIILVAALVVAVAGVLGNGGSAHAVSHFSILGYHLTGSAGTLFLSGIVVGAAGLLGLILLLAGARRTSRRGRAARLGLRQSRRETAAASQERDDLIGERDTARASAASQLSNGNGNGTAIGTPGPVGDRWSRLRDLSQRLAPRRNAAAAASASWPVTEVPVDANGAGTTAAASAPDVTASPPGPEVPAFSPAVADNAPAAAE